MCPIIVAVPTVTMRGALSPWLGCAIVFLFAGAATIQAVPQNPPPPAAASITERLARVRADLFAGAPHLSDDIKELMAILASDPSSADAHLLLGVAYRTDGSPDMIPDAKAEFQQALDRDPQLVPARFFLAQTYFDLGRFEKARDELTAALARMPAQPLFLALLGEAERQMGNPQRSVDLNRQALQSDATFAQARFYLGRALIDLHQRDAGIQEFETVVRGGTQAPDVLLALGSAYVDAGRIADAIPLLDQVTRVAPADSGTRIVLARAYRLEGALEKADQQLAIAEPPEQAKQPTGAYQKLMVDLNVERGQVRLQQKRLADAATALRAAIDMDPASAAAHRYLAEVLLRQGQYKSSLEHATQAGKLGMPLPDDLRKTLDEKLRGKAATGA